MTQSTTAFEFESIELNSSRLKKPVEMNRIVSDMEIFEHVQKPYLTARLFLVDDTDFYQDTDILGSEKITIKLRSQEENSKTIIKHFFISSIENIQKIQDNAQSIVIHLVEDIFYISSLRNVNRHYTGKPIAILRTIAKEFLGKSVINEGLEQQFLRCIVPNMKPLDALQWIASRACNSRGYPFYLYSTLVDKELRFEDLGTILGRQPLNPEGTSKYFVSSTKAQNTMDAEQMRRIIQNHEFTTQEDLLSVIRQGLISSSFEYIDTLTENSKKFRFDAKNDLYKKLIQDDILSKTQPNPAINFDEIINDKPINFYSNKSSTYIGGSMAFRDSDGVTNPFKYVDWTNSYGETKNGAEYKLKVIKNSFDALLKKNPLTININGIEFIKGDFHKTIGQNIDISFQATQNDAKGKHDLEDKKKSGKYLIYSMRHMFKRTVDKYDVTASCVKIGNAKRVDI